MQKQKKCLIGIQCLIRHNKNCRNHTLQEKEHVIRLQQFQRFNIILGVIKEEVDGLFGFPIGLKQKINFQKLAVISSRPLDGYQNYYYVLEFVSFEFGQKFPYYMISYEFGRIGDYVIEAEVKLFYESDLFQRQDKINGEHCQNGIYRVLFGNQHVIKGTDKKKIQFERACDQNRAFDGCVVNYKLNRQVRGQLFGQVVNVIKNPLINQNIIGMLSSKDLFEIEKRIKNPDQQIQQFDRFQELNEFLNQNTLYFKAMNSKLPTFQIIHISEELFKTPIDILNNFFIARYITWNKKSKYPWAEIIDTSGSVYSFKDYERIILEENNIKTDRFTQQINEESNKIIGFIQKDMKDIEINQEQIIFSIDNSNTQIIDDSLSIKNLADETYQINIYIAHPSFYINESSRIYRECRSRISNCYFKNFFRPMMPIDLQKQLSLSKNMIRKCYCVKIIIKQGYPLYDSLEIEEQFIINKYQLSYKQIQQIIEQKNQSSDKLEQTVLQAFSLANQLKDLRKTIGCSIILNDDYKNDDDRQYQYAKTLVTEFMILTNEAITYYVNQSTDLLRKSLNTKMEDFQQINHIEKQKKILRNEKSQLEKKRRQALRDRYKAEQQDNKKYQYKQINARNNDQQQIIDLQSYNDNVDMNYNNENENEYDKYKDQDNDNDNDIYILKIKQQDDFQQIILQSSSDESDSDSSSLNQLITLNRSLQLDQEDKIEDDFFDFNEMEYQDAKRNVQYLQERILQKLDLDIDLTSLITFRNTRLQIEENIKIDKFIRQYIKFQFRVKEKFLRICVLKNIQQQKKEKRIQSQQCQLNNQQQKQQKIKQNSKQAIEEISDNFEDDYNSRHIIQDIQSQQIFENTIETSKKQNTQLIDEDVQKKFENNSDSQQITQQTQLEQNIIKNLLPPSQKKLQNIAKNKNIYSKKNQYKKQILQQVQQDIINNIEPPKIQNHQKDIQDETQKQQQQIQQKQLQQYIIKNIEPPKQQISQSIMENIEEKIDEYNENVQIMQQIKPPKQLSMNFGIENNIENQNPKIKFNNLKGIMVENQISQYGGFPLLFQFYKSSQVPIVDQMFDNNQFSNSPIIFVFLQDEKPDQSDLLIDIDQQIEKQEQKMQDLDLQLDEIYSKIQKVQKSKLEYIVDQNKAKEVIEKYYTIQDKEKMKFTSPLRRFNDLLVHFLVKNILKLDDSIQNLLIECEFIFNDQSKPQKKVRGKQKSRKKQLSRTEIFNKLYKNRINEIMQLIKQKKEILRFAQGCDEAPSQTNNTAERQLEILILCKQIITKNCCINCDALITNIDYKNNKIQAYINTEGLEFEDFIEFDDKYFDSIIYFSNSIQYRDKITKQCFVLNQYDKCEVSLDCDGLFPLKLIILMKKKITD